MNSVVLDNNKLSIIERIAFSLSAGICKLPEKTAAAFGASLGLIAWRASNKERTRIENNIDRIFNRLSKPLPMPLETIVKKVFIHFGLVATEILRYPILKPADLKKRFTFQGYENIVEASKNGKGAILALPHIGNWEYLGAALVNEGCKLHSFYLDQKNGSVGAVLDHFRKFSGIILHDRDRGGVKALKALKNNEMLGMITDQDGNSNGVYTDFLGHWVSMPAGPANWSLKTGAKLIPLYALRKGYTFNYDAFVLPAFEDENDLAKNERVISRTVKLTKWLEDLILKYPHQYMWFYDRFRPRHEGYLTENININGQMCHGKPRYAE